MWTPGHGGPPTHHAVPPCSATLPHLPQLEELRLSGCDSLSDAGLARALPRCPALRRLHLAKCWLVTPAGLAAAAAAQQAGGGQLADVKLDDAAIELGSSGGAGGGGGRRASGAGLASSGAWPVGSSAGSGSATPATPARTRGRAGGERLTAEVLQHDERLAYSRQELLELRQAAAAAAAAGQMRARLPADLISGP